MGDGEGDEKERELCEGARRSIENLCNEWMRVSQVSGIVPEVAADLIREALEAVLEDFS